MNELTKIPLLNRQDYTLEDVTSSNKLSDLDKKNILAVYNSKKINKCDLSYTTEEDGYSGTEDFVTLSQIIIKAIWDIGFKVEKKELNILILNIIKDISSEFGHLSIPEIEIAFKNGSRNKYGDFFGMNIRTVNMWLSSYEKTTREEIKKTILMIPRIEQKVEISEEKKLELLNNWLNSVITGYNNFLETGKYEFYDFGNQFYMLLKRNNMIKLTSEQVKEIKNNAILQFKNSKSGNGARNYSDRIDYLHFIDKLSKGTVDKNDRLKTLCYHLSIPYIFDYFKNNNIDFSKTVKEIFKKDYENKLIH